jgi:hypothetical protein
MIPRTERVREEVEEKRRRDRPAFLFENVICRLDLS